jgi:hypothetical protein
MATTAPPRPSIADLPLGTDVLEHLQTVHPSASSDEELIERMIRTQNMINRLHALSIRDQTEFAYRRPDRPHPSASLPLIAQVSEFAADKFAPALNLNPRTARIRFTLALALQDELPCLVDAMYAGHLDYPKLTTLVLHSGCN